MSSVLGRSDADDAVLAESACRGDKDAFGQLIARHEPLARHLAERMLGDSGLAQETTQEATLLAWLSLSRLRCPARFGAWLCGIALNLARRCLRERRHLVWTADPDELVGDQRVDDPYEAAEITALVQQAVSRLPAGQREATLLFYWQGLTHAAVAAELGISIGAVKNRLHTARAALAGPLSFAVHTPEVGPTMSLPATPQWIEVSVAEIRRGDLDDPLLLPHVMLLRERHGERLLPVWIGRAEATALALSLETAEMPRPMTYQLTANLLTAASTRIHEVRITRLVDATFYAVLMLEGPVGPGEVDARPSDAVNLAMVTGAPVMVDAEVFHDPSATDRTDWRTYPTTGQQLVSEVRRQHQEMTPRREPR